MTPHMDNIFPWQSLIGIAAPPRDPYDDEEDEEDDEDGEPDEDREPPAIWEPDEDYLGTRRRRIGEMGNPKPVAAGHSAVTQPSLI